MGIIATDETVDRYPHVDVRSIGRRSDERTVAHNLFAVLRDFDDDEADVIFSEVFSGDELGLAIMNRLTKAAGYHKIRIDENGNEEETGGAK